VNGRVIIPCPVPLPILPFASDIVGLRTAIGLLRSQLALAPYAWTREIIAPGVWINSRDIIELRIALNGIYNAVGLPAVQWPEGPVFLTGIGGMKHSLTGIQTALATAQAVSARTVRYVYDSRVECLSQTAGFCYRSQRIGTLPSSVVSFASGYTTTREFADALSHALIFSGIAVDLIALTGVAPQTLAAAISTTLEAAALVLTGPPVGALGTLAYYLRVGSIAATVAVFPPVIHLTLLGGALAAASLSLWELWVTVNAPPSPWPSPGVTTTRYPPPPAGAAAADLEITLNWQATNGASDNWLFEVDW